MGGIGSGPKPCLTYEQIKQVYDRYISGEQLKVVAKDCHVDPRTLDKAFNRNGLPLRSRLKLTRDGVLTRKQTEWAYARYCEGYSLQNISKALYVDSSTVHNTFERCGYTFRKDLPQLVYTE